MHRCSHDHDHDHDHDHEPLAGGELTGPEPYLDLPPPPPEIAELVTAAFQYVTSAVGVPPDFTLETLPLVDHYLAQARAGLRERPSLEPLVTRALGAYFGEVVRRYVRSFWWLPSADAGEWRLCGSEVFLAFNPLGVVAEALARSAEHDGPSAELRLDPSEREAVQARLASTSPVSEEEYWLLSTRLEMLQIVADQLRTEQHAAGTADVSFDATDYGAPAEAD